MKLNKSNKLTPSDFHELSPQATKRHAVHLFTSSQQSGAFLYNDQQVNLPQIVPVFNGQKNTVAMHHSQEKSEKS